MNDICLGYISLPEIGDYTVPELFDNPVAHFLSRSSIFLLSNISDICSHQTLGARYKAALRVAEQGVVAEERVAVVELRAGSGVDHSSSRITLHF